MLSTWRKAASQISSLGLEKRIGSSLFARSSSMVAAAAAASPSTPAPSTPKQPNKPEVRLNALFWSKPCSLALPPNSSLGIEEPQYEGIRRFMLKLLLFYSKQSKSIRGANVVYRRIVSQVDQPAIYDVFQLEKTFKTTFTLLVLHMWLFLRRIKEEVKEGVEFGQYVYEIYNHDLELRVSKAGERFLGRWFANVRSCGFYRCPGNGSVHSQGIYLLVDYREGSSVLWQLCAYLVGKQQHETSTVN